MGGKSSSPAAPNYQALLTQQTEADKQTAATNTIANRPDVNTPTGSTTWTTTPGKSFDAQAYLAANPDVAAAAAGPDNGGMTPAQYALYHANNFGVSEGRTYDAAGDKLTAQYLGQFGTDGSAPTSYTEDQTLTPAQQALFNQSQTNQGTALGVQAQQLGLAGQQTGLAGTALTQAQQALATPQNFSSELAPVSTVSGPQAQTVSYDQNSLQKAQDALYAQQTQYLDPQTQQADQKVRAQLLASGLNENSQAFQTAMGNQQRVDQKNYSDARNSSITGADQYATDEQNRALAAAQQNFSQSSAISNFNQSEATRQQQAQLQNIGVQSSDRESSLKDYLSLLTSGGAGGSLMGGGYTTPNFAGASGSASDISSPDITGAAQNQFQAALDQVNASNARSAQTTQAGIGAAGSALAAYAAYAGSAAF